MLSRRKGGMIRSFDAGVRHKPLHKMWHAYTELDVERKMICSSATCVFVGLPVEGQGRGGHSIKYADRRLRVGEAMGWSKARPCGALGKKTA
jgi:hypothetical protein